MKTGRKRKERGATDGRDFDDWLAAEEDLKKKPDR